MTFDEYQKIDAINWSSLKLMAQSPRHYFHGLTTERTDTPALAKGRATHCAVLEPERFDAEYVVTPRGLDRRTKAGKAWVAEHAAKTAVSGTVLQVAHAVRSHPVASALLSDDTTVEQTIRWETHGVVCKGRTDAVSRMAMIDLKTTSVPLAQFATEAARYLYHGQLAYYLDGAIATDGCSPDATAYIIAVETRAPYDVGVFALQESDIRVGRALYCNLLDKLVSCMSTGIWHGRYPTVTPLALPPWAEGHDLDNGEHF